MDYDLYLKKEINLEKIKTSLLQSGKDYSQLLKDWLPAKGFQGFNLPEHIVADIAEIIIRNKEYSIVVPITYRNPKVTLEEAKKIADENIKQRQLETHKNIKFEDTQFMAEEAMYWKFGASSEELQDKGITPGVLTVNIDKLDGHIWSPIENLQLNFEEYYLDAATEISPEEIFLKWQSEFDLQRSTDYFDNNRECLRKDSIMIFITHHPFPGLINRQFGFIPKLHIRFRIIPHQKGYKSSKELLLQMTKDILLFDKKNLVLSNDRWELVTILERKDGNLIFNSLAENWQSINSSISQLPHQLKELMPNVLPGKK